MSTTLTKNIRKHIPYKITAKKQGFYEKQITQTFTEDNPTLDLGDLTPYDGLKYTADNRVPNYRTTTLDFTNTVLPFADNTKQKLKTTKYCLHDYRYKYKIPEYRAYFGFGTVGQGPKTYEGSSINNENYIYGFDSVNFLKKVLDNTDTIYSINSLYKFKYKKSSKGNRLFYYNDYHMFEIRSNDKFYVGGTYGSTVLEDNKDYWIQVFTTKTHVTVKLSTDGTNYNTEIDKDANVSFTTSYGRYCVGSCTSNYIFSGYIYYNASSVVVRWGTGATSDTRKTYTFIPNYFSKEINGTFTNSSDFYKYGTSIKNNVFIYPPEDEKYTAMGFQTKCKVSKEENFKVSFNKAIGSQYVPFEIKGILQILPSTYYNKLRISYKQSKDGSFINKDIALQNKNDYQNIIVKFKDTGISIGYCTGSGSTNYTYTDITDTWYEEGEYDLGIHGSYRLNNGTIFDAITDPVEINLSGIPGLPYISETYQGILYKFNYVNANSNYSCYCDSNNRVVLVDMAMIDESIYTNLGKVRLNKVTQDENDQIVENPIIHLDV
jgi:hypothetical protein